jgi:sulfotransferase
MIKKFIGLAGLPRSGSTLLSSILSQNPDIHAEGNSAVCQLMWDVQQSCKEKCDEQLTASNRLGTIKDLVASIPNTYYKNVTAPIIFDKCRSWTMPDNLAMLYKYFDHSPKVIVLERSIVEIIKSMVYLWRQNNLQVDPKDLLAEGTDYLMRSLYGLKWAKQNNKGEFLFIQYDDLVNNTSNVLNRVYEFCELESFKHDFDNIVNKHPENDEVYGLLGQHDIRPTIAKRDLDVTLSDAIIKRCKELEL